MTQASTTSRDLVDDHHEVAEPETLSSAHSTKVLQVDEVEGQTLLKGNKRPRTPLPLFQLIILSCILIAEPIAYVETCIHSMCDRLTAPLS
jgi:hypothetical protein